MPLQKSPEERMIRVNVWLTPEIDRWLKNEVTNLNLSNPHEPVNSSLYIRRLLAAQMNK